MINYVHPILALHILKYGNLYCSIKNLSPAFFEEHFKISNTRLNYWNDGISFSVCYELKIGWAIAYNCDSFQILFSENTSKFSSLPRNSLLNFEQIETTVGKTYSSRIDTISINPELKFATLEIALNTLIQAAKVNTLCNGRIFINDTSGNLIMEAYGEYADEFNSCIQGKIDLISGITESADIACRIN
ncbi:MAG: hypothetical protein RIA69_21015 [Cyclobacteriaceae bacterium]